MKKLFYIIITCNLLLATLNLKSQQPTQEWVRRYNSPYNMQDAPQKMVLDKFGNICVTGNIVTTNNGSDIVTVKYNPQGVQLWTAEYNQMSNTNETASSIAADSLGNIYVTGVTGFNLGPFKIVTIKYDSTGIQQWARIYYAPGNPDEFGGGICVDRSGNILIGSGYGPSYGTGAALLLKYSPNGDLIWSQNYTPTGKTASLGIVVDSVNNLYCFGSYYTSTRIHCLTAKFDSSGVFKWSNVYTNDTGGALSGIALSNDGNIYVTGVSTFSNVSHNFLTIKYTSEGILQWVRVTGRHISVFNY